MSQALTTLTTPFTKFAEKIASYNTPENRESITIAVCAIAAVGAMKYLWNSDTQTDTGPSNTIAATVDVLNGSELRYDPNSPSPSPRADAGTQVDALPAKVTTGSDHDLEKLSREKASVPLFNTPRQGPESEQRDPTNSAASSPRGLQRVGSNDQNMSSVQQPQPSPIASPNQQERAASLSSDARQQNEGASPSLSSRPAASSSPIEGTKGHGSGQDLVDPLHADEDQRNGANTPTSGSTPQNGQPEQELGGT